MATYPLIRTKILVIITMALAVAAALFYGFTAWQKQHPKTAGPVRITALPQQIWIEAGDSSQSLNFDFLVENLGPTPVGIDSIELTVFDSQDKPVLRRTIDSNGFAPSIETIPGRVVGSGARILVFNPFHSFRPDIELHRLHFAFSLSIPQEAPDTSTTVTIEPRVYVSKTALSLPVKGKSLVHDGHDYYSHHRRLNTEHHAAKDLGLTQNFMRYSLDLNNTNDNFEVFRDTGASNEDWYAWGQPVYASGDGTVVAATDIEPDNIRGGENFFRPDKLKTNPMHFYGNYLVIDHGNGEFSMLGHLQQGSLLVKAGDIVQRGQAIAKMGNSGSSNNPHLHFELRTGKDLQVEGLPAIFHNYHRHLGSKVLKVDAGPVDTGDMLETL